MRLGWSWRVVETETVRDASQLLAQFGDLALERLDVLLRSPQSRASLVRVGDCVQSEVLDQPAARALQLALVSGEPGYSQSAPHARCTGHVSGLARAAMPPRPVQ